MILSRICWERIEENFVESNGNSTSYLSLYLYYYYIIIYYILWYSLTLMCMHEMCSEM